MNTIIDLSAVEKTWDSIDARASRRPVFQVVPDEALARIEKVILANEDEAIRRWPSDHTDSAKNREDAQCRVQFAKEALLAAVPFQRRHEKGLLAVYFHEYIAASLRGDASDEFVYYLRRSSSPDIARRALAEAYQTCRAGLDESSVEWNS